MNSCCEVDSARHTAKAPCPACASIGLFVNKSTMLQHLLNPWLVQDMPAPSFFCENPNCEIVYFSQEGSTFSQSNLRTTVGLKNPGQDSVVCYCFGVTSSVAVASPNVRDFVIQQTKSKSCACEARNPSGQCCLKHFPQRGEASSVTPSK